MQTERGLCVNLFMPGLHPILLNKNVNNDESQFILNTQALFGC